MPAASQLSMLETKQAQLQKAQFNPARIYLQIQNIIDGTNATAKTVNPKLLDILKRNSPESWQNVIMRTCCINTNILSIHCKGFRTSMKQCKNATTCLLASGAKMSTKRNMDLRYPAERCAGKVELTLSIQPFIPHSCFWQPASQQINVFTQQFIYVVKCSIYINFFS